jgi:hypothetical protein
MPNELWLKKLETTPMCDDEDALDGHNRSVLRDRTCDAPLWASDQPRSAESQDHARSHVMNMRFAAARTPAEPIHPDLFLGFTDRDPRGHATAPDFRKMHDQSWSRGRYADFLNDDLSDQTIPEGAPSNLQIMLNVRKAGVAAKSRLKIFSTSRDGRAVAAPQRQWNEKSRAALVTTDGTLLDLNSHAGAYNRTDNTVLKGYMHRTGWRSTGDHIVPVAQYSINSARQTRAELRAAEATTDHVFEATPVQVRNRIARVVAEEAQRRKYFEDYRGDMQHNFDESSVARNVIGRLTAEIGNAQWEVGQTAEFDDDGRAINTTRRVVQAWDPTARDTVLVDQDIFAAINEHKNVSFRKMDAASVRDARQDAVVEDGVERKPAVQVANYRGVVQVGDDRLETLHEQRFVDPTAAPHRNTPHARIKEPDASATRTEHGQIISDGATFRGSKSGASQHWRARERTADSEVRPESADAAEHFRGFRPVRAR